MYRINDRPLVFLMAVYAIASLFTLVSYGPGIEAVRNIALIATGCLLLFIYAYYFGLLEDR